MPNWVMNELTCIFQTSEEYNAFKMKANTDALYDSFFPMPEVLDGTRSPHQNPDAYIATVNLRKNTNFLTLEGIALSGDEWDAETAKALIKNIKAFEQTGYHDWYTWNLDNWGVKWDASDCKTKDLPDFNTIVFSFNSPWGTPEHFVRELSKLYPTSTFEMVSGSIENDSHYEFTCEDGKFEETCSYETFREAVVDGKWGGMEEWADMFEESEEV
jgi:hypothetical protein